MMNRIFNRAVSLLLAVLFLTGAGGLSFFLFFESARVYADSGVATVTIKEIKQGDYPVTRLTGPMSNLTVTFEVTGASQYTGLKVAFERDGAFTATTQTPTATNVTTSSGKYKFQFTVTGCTYNGHGESAVFSLFQNSSDTYSASLNEWLNGDGNSYSLQSYVFYGTDDKPLTRMRKGTNISKVVFIVKETGVTAADYNSADKKDFSATLNYATFSKINSREPEFSAKATSLRDGISYTLTFYDLRYTGKTDRLELKIGYPQSFGLERRLFTETLTEGELYQPDGSGSSSDSSSDDSSTKIAPPTPNIIIASYDYGGGSPTAASNVMLDVTFTNTSQKLLIENIVMKVAMPEAFTLTNSSNTFYIPQMAAGSLETRSVGFTIKPAADPISHPIKISFTYEAVIKEERQKLTSEMEISIPVSQLNRVTLNPVEIPMEIYMEQGNTYSFEAVFINMGKSTIYNVSATLIGENMAQAGILQFVGNVESGKQASADFTLEPLAPGPIIGEVVLTYEDANMNISELRTPFQSQAIEVNYGPPPDMNTEFPPDQEAMATVWYQKIPVWSWMVIAVVGLIGASFAVKLVRAVRQKKLEAEDEDF